MSAVRFLGGLRVLKTISAKIAALCTAAFLPAVLVFAGAIWMSSQQRSLNEVLRSETAAVASIASFDAAVRRLIASVEAEGRGTAGSAAGDFDAQLAEARSLLADLNPPAAESEAADEAAVTEETVAETETTTDTETTAETGPENQEADPAPEQAGEGLSASSLTASLDALEAEFATLKDSQQAIAGFESDFSNNLLKGLEAALSDLTAVAYNDGGQELVANVSTVERAVLRTQLAFVEFLASPGEETAKSGEAAIKALRNDAKRARSTFRKAGKAEAKALFKAARGLEKPWGALTGARLSHRSHVASVIRDLTAKLNAEVAALAEARRAESAQESALVESQTRQLGFVGGTLSVAILLAVALAVLLVTRLIARNLSAQTLAMRRLADNELEITITGTERDDDLGEMARALAVFQNNAKEKIALEERQREALERSEAEKRATMNQLADSFEESVNEIVGMVSSASEQLVGLAHTMREAAQGATARSGAASTASGEATSNMQSIASASSEMNSAIAEVSSSIDSSAQRTGEAARSAETTNEKVAKLSSNAETIGDVVSLIRNIAEQTNLLALNATIEAARAGEAGKGFAVVAGEVKSLANQTAKATEEISQQIGTMQEDTAAVVSAIDAIGRVIHELNETSSSIASVMKEQNDSARDIASNTNRAVESIQEVSSNISSVKEAAGDTETAAEQVLSASSQLAETSTQLSQAMVQFVERVRAA